MCTFNPSIVMIPYCACPLHPPRILLRSDKDESLVTLEQFQEAFRDIGTACAPHLPPRTEPLQPEKEGAACDDQQSDALFDSILASVTT